MIKICTFSNCIHWLYAAEIKPRIYSSHTFLCEDINLYIHGLLTIFLFSFTLTMAMLSLTCTQRYSKATGSLLKRSMGSFGTKLILKRHLILCELGLWVTQDSAIIIRAWQPWLNNAVSGNVTLLQSYEVARKIILSNKKLCHRLFY